MDAVSSEVDNRAGKTFEVDLYVPWDAPEAVVDVSSAGVTPLRNLLDIIGLVGRRDNVTESRILQGRDPRSIRVPVPDGRGLDQNFNDVTIVDMGDLPESHVSMPELGEFIQKWPPAVINHMMWRQRELEHLWLKGSLDRNIPRLARFAAQSLRMVCIDMWLAAI